VKFGRKPKLTPQQIAHARKLIDQGEDRQKVDTLFKVGRKTLYRALATSSDLTLYITHYMRNIQG
jgi:DNA invertase Pin-like site-specific DNA recombinase